jgi:3-carboxy-cis,cis-muconate cycloisomerase
MRELVSSQLTAMIQEHERAVAAMPLEWMVIPEAFLLLSGSLKHALEILPRLEVDQENMLRNLNQDGGQLMAEAVMMGLAPIIGRPQAHELISQCSLVARESGLTLREALQSNQEVRQVATLGQIDQWLEPANYLGTADQMISIVLENASKVIDTGSKSE